MDCGAETMDCAAITPNDIAAFYERMPDNVEIVRNRLGRVLTLSEKLLLGHFDNLTNQTLEVGKSQLSLRPNRAAFQDVLGQTGMLQFV